LVFLVTEAGTYLSGGGGGAGGLGAGPKGLRGEKVGEKRFWEKKPILFPR